jgi:HD-GYP domain-containing protein (c-di-GMP phosphodiesterase class II)
MPRGVLVIDQDITQAVAERERRERNLQQLVQTLVTVVDRRDPHAAHHSSRVAIAARATAGEMGLEEVLVETAAIAGSLLNLGKILVPSQLLTKEGQLSEEEMRTVRDSIQTSAELIEGIEFDGPVVETLRQAQERWDGSGVPRGLKGDQILVTARIIAVANAFVAIVSPRAHRPGVDFDAAVESLLKQIGSAFDRAVVAALIHYMDNRGGRERWADFVEPVPEA